MPFFCGKCGTQLDDGTKFCTKCGAPADTPAAAQMPVQQPVYQQQYYQPEPPKSPALAICAFVFSFILAPVGLILGIVGLAKRNAGLKGMSIAAVIIGAIGTLLTLVLTAILVPSMLGYVNRSRQTSANAAAATIVRTVSVCLIDAENAGFGMKPGRLQEFDIKAVNGKWTVSAADPDNFFSNGTSSWGQSASGIYDDVVKMAPSGENELLLALADKLPDINKASIHIAVYDGRCTACAFSQETYNTLAESVDYPKIDEHGEFSDYSRWKDNNKSRIIGLFPIVTY